MKTATLIAIAALTLVAAVPANAQLTYTVVHTFSGVPDGAYPNPIIRDPQGNLFGTTVFGGAACGISSCGTVYKIDPAGNETVLFSFPGGSLGSNPIAPVAEDSAGNLYGTTEGDGALGVSLIYKIDTSGEETVLAPKAITGGSLDSGILVDESDNLYGMTPYGGDFKCTYYSGGCGSLFKVTASGTYSTLHSFVGADGIRPEGGLVEDAKGNLYGAAFYGGEFTCKTTGFQYPYDAENYQPGCGTIYKLAADGKFSILHTFTGKTDGAGPLGLIIDAAGNLYGIAQNGGDDTSTPYGLGTIFKLDTKTGAFSVLFTFTPPVTNSTGYASHLARDAKGNLYGAKQYDGANNTGCLFEVNTVGTFTDLFDFPEQTDGSPEGYFPVGIVLGSAGDYFGSMFIGELTGDVTFGTVFHITP